MYISGAFGFLLFSGCGRNVVLDLGFAVDGSGSIDSKEYRLTKDFVQDVIQAFHISPQGTHVGVVEYGSRATVKIKFNEHYDRNSLITAVEALKQAKSPATDITDGLKKTLELFGDKHGARGREVLYRYIFNAKLAWLVSFETFLGCSLSVPISFPFFLVLVYYHLFGVLLSSLV